MNSMRNQKLRRQGNVHVRRQLQGNTALHDQPAEGRSEPRLPHEHDESADHVGPQSPESRTLGLQAGQDLKEGRRDTDLGPVIERTNAQLNATPPPAADPAPVPSPPPSPPPSRDTGR